MNTTEDHTDDYDSPWKEGMELYFKELMQFFFPNIAREIAWSKGYQFLDKELQQVVLKGRQPKTIHRKDTPGNGPLPGRSMKKAFPQKTSWPCTGLWTG